MPAIEYTELSGLNDEEQHVLALEYIKWSSLAMGFNVGPGTFEHAVAQGIMRVLNKAEEMGLITINHKEDQ